MTLPSNERSSLLSAQSKPFNRHIRPLLTRAQSSLHNIHVPQTHSPKVVLCMLTFMIFTIMFGIYCMMVPYARVYEDIICHNYYDHLTESGGHIELQQDIPERLCKGNEVQKELAFVMGIRDSVQSIPGILFAYPYGRLSDKWGRKKIFGLASLGVILSELYSLMICWFWGTFPLRMVWLSSIFLSIGGGTGVLQNMLYATLSDVSTDETRANNFFAVSTGVLMAEIIAPTVAAYLMEYSPWIPLLLGYVLLILGFCVMIFIPETLKMHSEHGHITENSPSTVSTEEPMSSSNITNHGLLSRTMSNIASKFNTFKDDLSIFNSTTLIILLVSFLIHPLMMVLSNFFPRYISKRFSWSLADSSYIMSFKAIVNIFLMLAILPGISHLLSRKSGDSSKWYTGFGLGLSTRSKDLVLARGSLFFLIVGAVLLGLSPTVYSAIFALTLWTLGTGFSSACRSLITMLVDQQHVGRLYAVVSLVEVFGLLSSSPLVATLYSWGLEQAQKSGNDAWIGAPFYAITLVVMVCGIGVLFITLPAENKVDSAVDENTPLFGA